MDLYTSLVRFLFCRKRLCRAAEQRPRVKQYLGSHALTRGYLLHFGGGEPQHRHHIVVHCTNSLESSTDCCSTAAVAVLQLFAPRFLAALNCASCCTRRAAGFPARNPCTPVFTQQPLQRCGHLPLPETRGLDPFVGLSQHAASRVSCKCRCHSLNLVHNCRAQPEPGTANLLRAGHQQHLLPAPLSTPE